MSLTDVRDLLEILDAIRCGDATREGDLPPIPGECWDGVADLIAEPPRGYRDPMNEGWLRTLVEAIWHAQEAIAFWQGTGEVHEFMTRYGQEGDLTHGAGAAWSLIDHYEADRDANAAQILTMVPAWSPARYRTLAGTRLALVGA